MFHEIAAPKKFMSPAYYRIAFTNLRLEIASYMWKLDTRSLESVLKHAESIPEDIVSQGPLASWSAVAMYDVFVSAIGRLRFHVL